MNKSIKLHKVTRHSRWLYRRLLTVQWEGLPAAAGRLVTPCDGVLGDRRTTSLSREKKSKLGHFCSGLLKIYLLLIHLQHSYLNHLTLSPMHISLLQVPLFFFSTSSTENLVFHPADADHFAARVSRKTTASNWVIKYFPVRSNSACALLKEHLQNGSHSHTHETMPSLQQMFGSKLDDGPHLLGTRLHCKWKHKAGWRAGEGPFTDGYSEENHIAAVWLWVSSRALLVPVSSLKEVWPSCLFFCIISLWNGSMNIIGLQFFSIKLWWLREEEEEKGSDFVTQQSGALFLFWVKRDRNPNPALSLCLCGFLAVTTSLAF